MNERLVTLPAGTVRGSADSGIASFLSIPYAAPPEGPLRFAPPAPVPVWQGVRDATVAGPIAPQSPMLADLDIDVTSISGPSWQPGSADYLTLNVWRPDDARSGLPVMLFIHGGGFVAGSKDVAICDGSAFARDGILCVAINYRLGIEGFLPIPGVPTNLGLRDQIAALHWVKDHIALFGGDPDNVTVFGESAGAVSVGCLLASPLAEGLFRRAIMQSGHAIIRRSIPVAQRAVRRLAKYLGIRPDADGFRSIDHEAGLRAQERIARPFARIDLRDEQGIDSSFGISRFFPVYGDDVLPDPPERALANGAGANVELLIGTNAEEMNIFTIATGMRDKLNQLVATYVLHRSFPHARKALKAYGLGQKGVTPGKAFTDAANDLVFRAPARSFAALHRGRTHVFEFEWQSPAFDGQLGAAHVIELPFVFDTLATASGKRGLLGVDPPQDLADRVHALWVRFGTDGELCWPEFDDETRQVYLLEKGEARHEPVLPAAVFLPD
jgi:para-nitrobenzyl esterase